ncbi:membrane lipoprotein lipid attachment site-containing protein [Acinetobacter bereziniae]|uniref:membrane lipoprotein lipid attachment site-containing protein n=1 Tax=Acinetobacter bereziniae TaxID=106648 RepID=UPI00124FFEC3|nr:membrane lipoprotein lipid attachment site-containing protein [Acinetobacter bereziniae]
MKKILMLGFVLALTGCSNSEQSNTDSKLDKKETKANMENGKWEIIESKDEMRNITTRWVALRSENNADLRFPYDGDNKLQLDILGSKNNDPTIYLTIDKGQYDCADYGCYVAVKFGNSTIQNLTFQQYDAAGTNGKILIFTDNSKAFLENIRNLGSLTIELPFYSDGRRQFKFDTSKFNEAERKI